MSIQTLSRDWLIGLCIALVASQGERRNGGAQDCYDLWLRGHRIAASKPQKTVYGVSLKKCKDECFNIKGCAAFAYGRTGSANGTCELAISRRDSRSTDGQAGNETISYDDVDRAPPYDVYIESLDHQCYETSALFSSTSSNYYGRDQGHTGVPIDCFYRLMSAKRLSKFHIIKSVTVNTLQECQESCISERSFSCRSISYRYMPSGYTYPVSNCELSAFFLAHPDDTAKSKYDFVEDYDYDYFQREPHCKTTSSIGANFGVCAVVVRRGAKLSSSLIKSSHHVTTSSQCEHLCITGTFRCRAFAFRHTTHGRTVERDPFHRNPTYPASRDDESCLLYDADLTRIPAYNVQPDQDYDLLEMGRLMGAECVLYDQYMNSNHGGRPGGHFQSTGSSSSNRPSHNPSYGRDQDRYRPSNTNYRPRPRPSGGGYYNDHHYSRPEDRVDRDRGRYPYNSPHAHAAQGEKKPYIPPYVPPPDYHPQKQQKKKFSEVEVDDSFPPPPGHDTHPLISNQNSGTQVEPPTNYQTNHKETGNRYPSRDRVEYNSKYGGGGSQYVSSLSPQSNNHGSRPHGHYPPPENRYNERPSSFSIQQYHTNSNDEGNYALSGNGNIDENHLHPVHDSNRFVGVGQLIENHNEMKQQKHHQDSLNPAPISRPGIATFVDDTGSTKSSGGPGMRPGSSDGSQGSHSSGGGTESPLYYDKRKEVCLISLKRDHYLLPDVSRATFPVKTLEECRVECIRSIEVLRFPCRVMGYRRTSPSGGSCQLSDTDQREIMERDYVPSRDRYESAETFYYDDRDPVCRRNEGRYTHGGTGLYGSSGNHYGGSRYGGSSSHWDRERYPGGRVENRYPSHNYYPPARSKGYYDDRRYGSGGNYNRYGYKDYYNSRQPGGSSGSGWHSGNYHGTSRYDRDRYQYGSGSGHHSGGGSGGYGSGHYGGSGSGGYGSGYYGGGSGHYGSNHYFNEYRNGEGHLTVNGERCLKQCRKNRDAGFYYCQVGHDGSWDFCCRPDHFCGYSTGLSVPWCYVGSGPSHNIWRSCNRRLLSQDGQSYSPNVAYLHERPPPTVHTLTNTEVASLSKDNALKLFNGSKPNFELDDATQSSHTALEPFQAKPHEGNTPHIITLTGNDGNVDENEILSSNTESFSENETQTPSIQAQIDSGSSSKEENKNSTVKRTRSPKSSAIYSMSNIKQGDNLLRPRKAG